MKCALLVGGKVVGFALAAATAFVLIFTVAAMAFVEDRGQNSQRMFAGEFPLVFFLAAAAIFLALSLIYSETDGAGDEFLSYASGALCGFFLYAITMHLLGSNVFHILSQHDLHSGGSGLPVFEGLAHATPYWLLVVSIAVGGFLVSIWDRADPLGIVLCSEAALYLALKLYLLL